MRLAIDITKAGFTVIEIIMIILIAGIIAVIVMPGAFKGTSSVGAGTVAAKIKDDIRYTQSLAFARHNLDSPPTVNVNDPKFTYRIVFNVNPANPADPYYPVTVNCPGTNKYAIISDENNDAVFGSNPNGLGVVESARNPYDGSQYFCITLGAGDYAGITINANFGGTVPGVLVFDASGIPYNSDMTRITAPNNWVTVTKGSETATITVTPNTGLVSVQ